MRFRCSRRGTFCTPTSCPYLEVTFVLFRRLSAFVITAALVVAGLVAIPAAAQAVVPDTPDVSGLAARPIDDTNTTFQLSWAPVAGALGYSVSLTTAADAAAPATVLTSYTNSVTTTAFLATAGNVSTEQTVFWRVAAYGQSGTATTLAAAQLSPYSGFSSFTRAAIGAPTPTSPLGSIDEPTSIVYPEAVTFAWEPVAGAQSYTVSYSQSASFASGVTSATTTGTTLTPTTLLSRDGVWYWRVTATIVAYAFSSTTQTTQVTTSSAVQAFTVTWDDLTTGDDESQPVLLSQQDVDTTTDVLSDPILTWTPVSGAASYRVQLGNAKQNGVITSPKTFTTYGTTFVPTTLLADQDWYWQVTALDSAGNAGTPSAIKRFQKAWGAQTASTAPTLTGVAAPVAVTGGSTLATPETYPIDRLELSWNGIARASKYLVSVYTVKAGVPGSTPNAVCTTANTSVTIVTSATEVTDAVDGMGSCLWPSRVVDRLSVYSEGANPLTYKWTVQAIASDANTPATTISSAASTPRYFRLSPADGGSILDPNEDIVNGDAAAWSQQTVSALQGQAAPVFTWEPVTGANLYVVEVALNKEFTSTVARFSTTGTTLRPTGVFDDTTTINPYYWRVKAGFSDNGTTLSEDRSQFPLASDPGFGWRNWKKSSTKSSFDGVVPVSQVDGTTILRWAPQGRTALADGGSTGYVVKIYPGGSATGTPVNGAAGTKTNYPFMIARTSAGVPLTENSAYSFTVAPLDANGNAGNASEPKTFTVAASAPVLVDPEESATRLSWSPTAGAQKYTVALVAPDGVTVPSGSASIVTAQTSVSLPPLVGSTGGYSWKVTPTRPLTVAGTPSAWSSLAVPMDTIPVVTSTGRVLAPFTSDSTSGPADVGAGRILAWEPVEGATGYIVSTTPSNTTKTTVATNYVIPDPVSYGVGYSWKVRAVVGALSTTTPGAVVAESVSHGYTTVTLPSAVTLGAIAAAGTTVTAKWTALSGDAKVGSSLKPTYILQWRNANDADWSDARSVETVDAVAYAVTGLATGTTYQFRLAARDADGNLSPWNQYANVKTATAPTSAPAIPTTTPGVGSLTATWAALPSSANGGSPVTGYAVRYRKSTASTWVTTTVSTPKIVLSALATSTSYRIEVAASNVVGTGPFSGTTASTLSLPSAAAAPAVKRGDRSATVTWKAPTSNGGSPITGYYLDRRSYSTATKTWSSWRATALTTTTYAATGLVNGTGYQFRVAARTKLGTGTYSAASLTVTPAGKPSAPTKVAVKATTGKFTISWAAATTNGSAITGYTVQYSATGKTWTTLKSATPATRSFTTTAGTKGKTYWFRVLAKNAVGSSPSSSVVKSVKK
ncbi:fibronectin type III domain-containing protein [Leifsonia sp. Leaf264]|uniref:fibronectin type III domain-containing protein n=1 Tax=Leifsonia sp. Leaf264 TaxID=1736314 RepID=UPI0006FA513C|nr:fibronectin type III domain-containing protein [Leifsonia sp. Leaf264]KQP01117.1 hypothetical protein ASF30_00270 [Leifsonia sp. Leaf264]